MSTGRRRNLLDQILVSTDSCLCIVDARRRIRFFSPGLERWTGWPAASVEGLSCDSLASDRNSPVDLLAASFHPTADVWQGKTVQWQAVLPTANGGVVRSDFLAVPISNEAGQIERVLILRSAHDGSTDTPEVPLGQQLHAEVAALRADFRRRHQWDTFLGGDESLTAAIQLAELLTHSRSHFVIQGESGTGRRHLAGCIHVAGQDAESTVVPVYCDLLSSDVLYDSLRQLRQTRTEQSAAHEYPGLLLFVDVDRIPREVQSWVLEEIGQWQDVRLAGTCEVSLQQMVHEGWMLPEFQRLLAPIEIQLPPLRQRGNDPLLLAHEFVQQNHRRHQSVARELAAETGRQLLSYHWPGNVRELEQVIHDACRDCEGDVVQPEHLPFAFRAGVEAQQLPTRTDQSGQSLDELLQEAEQRIIQATLQACQGNKAEAARRLGLSRPAFYRRLKHLSGGTETGSAASAEG